MAEKHYQRLTAWRRRHRFTFGPVASSSLWLGRDHLLKIESSYFTEEYKRFYFRDIQSVTIRRTRRREFWNLVLGLIAIPIVGLMLTRFLNPLAADTWLWLVWVSALVVVAAVHNLLGPTCSVHIRTAVQIEEVPSLSRMPQTQKVLTRIRPLIDAAQGGHQRSANGPLDLSTPKPLEQNAMPQIEAEQPRS